ncbi:MAG: hypothetical protein GYB65_14745 [Chloroflexi bacterium]|nr:hypothetical protein [Chloroflexota bacterium]
MAMPSPPRQETMAPHERMGAIMMGQKPDRVPFSPFIFGFCAKNVGLPVSTVYEDAEKSFFAQLRTAEMYGYDGAPLYGYASYGGWEFGGDIKMPRSRWEQAPVVAHYPVESEEDVDRLELPDVERAGSLPISMTFSRLQEKFGMPITVQLVGVVTLVGELCSVDRMCRWMIKRPELVHKLMRKAVDHLVDVAKLWVDTFPVERMQPFVGDATSANQVISPKQFEEFALPYQKEVHEKVLDMGVMSMFNHICGEQNLNLPFWRQIPHGRDGVPGILSFGHEVDLTTAIEMFGEDNIIAGNVEPRLIQNGTPEEVFAACVACLEKGKQAPNYRYMLMAGCEVPVEAPPYNLFTMRKAVMEHGFYD